MSYKTLISAILAITIVIATSIIGIKIVNIKDDVILNETDKFIYVKQYSQNLSIDKKTKDIIVTYDSTYKHFKQKKLMYEGNVVKAAIFNDTLIIRTKNKQMDISSLFDHAHISRIKDEKPKYIKVYQQYYPKETFVYETFK